MSNRELRKLRRLKDSLPLRPARASKKMDAFVSRPSDDTSGVSDATAEEPSLSMTQRKLRLLWRTSKVRLAKLPHGWGGRTGCCTGNRRWHIQTAFQNFPGENTKVQEHIDDLDNRGRRCNVKILGIPELKEGDDMIQFLQQQIPVMLERQFPTLEIQRAHRVPTGPPRREQRVGDRPQPVMVNILRYQVKEDILWAAKEKGQISWQGARIMFFPNYSKRTTERRVSFKHFKTDLRNRGVEHTLRFPATLEIKHNGAHHRFNLPKEASEFIKR